MPVIDERGNPISQTLLLLLVAVVVCLDKSSFLEAIVHCSVTSIMLKVSVDKYIRTLCQIIYEILPKKFYLTKQTALWICKQHVTTGSQ